MQTLTLAGNLGSDAVVREVGERFVIGFSVAHSEKYKDKDGVQHEKTWWWDCSIWKNKGQSTDVAKYLKKGTPVSILGRPDAEAYPNKTTGELSVSLKCVVREIQLMGSAPVKAEAAGATQASAAQKAQQATPITDNGNDGSDLPF